MIISELIEELQTALAQYGDVTVKVEGWDNYNDEPITTDLSEVVSTPDSVRLI